MYQAKKTARSEFVPIRTLKYHVLVWGEPGPGKVPLVMVHGWMDVGASYQFVVDALAQDHYVIAPDWRGYGLTAGPPVDNYWLPDYCADLDFLLDHYSPEAPVHLVGHSMGGNVVMHYAGMRPQRVRRLVNLEGFGMAQTLPAEAPERYRRWMDELKALHRGEVALNRYDTVDGVAARLMKTNARLSRDKADWLAPHWSRQDPDGKWRILGDPAHKIIGAMLSRLEEVLELYKSITAPTLSIEASDNSLDKWWQGSYTLAQYHERLQSVPNARTAHVPDAGHMLHHDQPERVARLIEEFFLV